MENPGTRLAAFRSSLKKSQRALAVSVGVSQSIVAQIERHKILPSRSFLQAMSERYHVSADWLLHGIGEMLMPEPVGFQGDRYRVEPPDPGQPLAGDFRSDGVSYALVPRLDLDFSAGPGRTAAAQPPTLPGLALPRSWFIEAGVSADFCRLVRIRGDSMGAALPDGATALLDCSQRFLSKPGVYAFTNGDGDLQVKRLLPALDARGKAVSVTILSDNAAFAAQVVTGEDMNALRIHGLVRAVLSMV